jgi:molybdenum cofactor cytidylyltransferase
VSKRVAAIVLAAGRSSRMGANKLLVEIDGRPMIAHVLDMLRSLELVQLVVVLGHDAERVRAAAGDAEIVLNDDYARGMSTSIQRGAAAITAEADAILIVLGDMPFVRPSDVQKLIDAFDGGIVAPVHAGRRGNPVLFARRFMDEVSSLTGDVGARAILERHRDAVVEVEVSDRGVHLDVDTPEGLEES